MSGTNAEDWGTVVALVGRYLAGRIDLLTHERIKSLVPISGSPYALAGAADPALQHLVHGERTVPRERVELRKDLATSLAASGADFLVVDNTGAVLQVAERAGRFYSAGPRDDTDLMDLLWGESVPERPSARAGDERLLAAYDAFVDACLAVFEPSRIILLQSQPPAFWLTPEGRVEPTDARRADAELISELDARFAERTGCLVSTAAVGRVPRSRQWHSMDGPTQTVIEDDLVRLIRIVEAGDEPPPAPRIVPPPRFATKHVLNRLRSGNQQVDRRRLRRYFRRGKASYDDLLALVHLQQEIPDRFDGLVRACVRDAVRNPRTAPVAATRAHFRRSLAALRADGDRAVELPAGDLWRPQAVVDGDDLVLRFLPDGSVDRVRTVPIEGTEAADVAEGRTPVGPERVRELVRSWPVYLERGRRGITAAPVVEVPDVGGLVDTCAWIDWRRVLESERVVLAGPARGWRSRLRRPRRPEARVDLSFLFSPSTRIGTVGGGLMDQVTHIALFDELCRPHGLDLYLDDLRYLWWRSHNGFEAHRLAPELDEARISRRLSQDLRDRFRTEVRTVRLPWVFNQSHAWQQLGLHEGFVVTRDYFNARRLQEMEVGFPFLVYPEDDDLAELVRTPPGRVTFYTTQHRIAIAPDSAGPLRRVFSYHHLDDELPPEAAETAAALRSSRHVALHVRRGDYLESHFDQDGWFAQQQHYVDAIRHLIDDELGTADFDIAVFSDDLAFVEANADRYGLDLVTGTVRYVRGNQNYGSIVDSYLMSLCPVIVGSVGFFAATTALLADPPNTFVWARPGRVAVAWRRGGGGEPELSGPGGRGSAAARPARD